ncbi:MAG: ferritin-like domain-containing protein, partial [Solirubrobacteraceae bacterium]|nr:ferritin-like domain-containing protein [Patulibacter sp.]
LKGVLGAKAVKEPTFDFKGTNRKSHSFLATAKVLEDTGVAAYQGQAPLIHQNAVLAPAGGILATEARHAAWVRDLLGAGKTVKPAPEAFSTPKSMSEVLKAVKATGFIKS